MNPLSSLHPWLVLIVLLVIMAASPRVSADFRVTAVPQHPFPQYPGSMTDAGVFIGPDDAPIYIAKPGDSAPGTNSVFGYGQDLDNGIFGGGYFNAAGQVVFRGYLSGQPDGSDQGIWFGSANSLGLVVRGGTDLGLLGEGIAYQVIPWSINASGHLTYEGVHGAGSAHPGGSETIWAVSAAGTRLLLSQDAPAPGLGAGVTFAYGNTSKIDDRDNIEFIASLAGPGISEDNDLSLWVSDPQGLLTLIAREGSPLIVDGQSRGIVSSLAFIDHLNDSSALYFNATFADNSTGEFAIVPEPATIGMVALAVCAISCRARRWNDRP